MTDEVYVAGAVAQAARDDERLKVMKALRARVAVDLDNLELSGRDLAALSKRLMELQNEIDAIRANAAGRAGVKTAGDGGDGGDGLADAAATPAEPFPPA